MSVPGYWSQPLKWGRVMDPVMMIATALTAGAAAGLAGTASTAVHDAYAALRDGVRRLSRGAGRGDREASTVVDVDSSDLVAHRERLVAILAKAGDGQDVELVALARRLLELLDPAGARAGKYAVNFYRSKGAQVGDGNTQYNTFN